MLSDRDAKNSLESSRAAKTLATFKEATESTKNAINKNVEEFVTGILSKGVNAIKKEYIENAKWQAPG